MIKGLFSYASLKLTVSRPAKPPPFEHDTCGAPHPKGERGIVG
jgi:hypothetical protein